VLAVEIIDVFSNFDPENSLHWADRIKMSQMHTKRGVSNSCIKVITVFLPGTIVFF